MAAAKTASIRKPKARRGPPRVLRPSTRTPIVDLARIGMARELDAQRIARTLASPLPRSVFRVQHERKAGAWVVRAGSVIVCAALLKQTAVEDAVVMARALHVEHGIRAQVVIHGINGRIQEERTYPDTTPRAKG